MKNLGNMLKQAQEMQAKMAEMQDSLADLEVTGEAGAGLVRATATGKGELKSVVIDPKVVDPDDVSMLEDLIVAAVNAAKAKADQETQAKTAELMGGMQLPPGFKLPF